MTEQNSMLYTLHQRLQAAQTKEKREECMLDLAEAALKTYDPTDAEDCDDYHQFFEEFQEARTKYRQMAMRLGRMVSQALEVSSEDHPLVTVLDRSMKAN